MSQIKTSFKNINLINNINIKTNRMRLQKFSLTDVNDNVAHEMNPEIMQYIRDPMTLEETTAKTMTAVPDWNGEEGSWVLISLKDLDNNQHIGMVCMRYLSIENDTVEIGWRLGPDHHGRGLATEGAKALLSFIDTELKSHKVVAYCVAENIASSNIMKKLGMHHEARFKEFSKLGGKWRDEDVYGLVLH